MIISHVDYFCNAGYQTHTRLSNRLDSNMAKGRISKRVRIRGQEMFVFRKIWRALFSCYLRFENYQTSMTAFFAKIFNVGQLKL